MDECGFPSVFVGNFDGRNVRYFLGRTHSSRGRLIFTMYLLHFWSYGGSGRSKLIFYGLGPQGRSDRGLGRLLPCVFRLVGPSLPCFALPCPVLLYFALPCPAQPHLVLRMILHSIA